MNSNHSFSISDYENQAHIAERELSAFVTAVTELFGVDQARAATEDWLQEAELMDIPLRSTSRDWRSVTVAASARLASRIEASRHAVKSNAVSTDTKVLPILSSDCFRSTILVSSPR
jgi:hypothetical protein